MKKQSITTLSILLLATPFCFAQGGSLTPPPGAPAPTMKSLDIIEARTPLVAGAAGVSIDGNGTITISQPGSYYLTGNLTISVANANGINIGTTDSVTIDLNGFTIRNSAASPNVQAGIFISGSTSQAVTIRNGHIRGPGFLRGIIVNSSVAGSVIVDSVSVSNISQAIFMYADSARTVVTNCTVTDATTFAIRADIVKNCTVKCAATSTFGISASTVSDCYVDLDTGNGNAISANVVQNSVGIANSGIGIIATAATNSSGVSTQGTYGMNISGTASFCYASRPSGTALNAGIAIGCTANGTVSSSQKHLGTP